MFCACWGSHFLFSFSSGLETKRPKIQTNRLNRIWDRMSKVWFLQRFFYVKYFVLCFFMSYNKACNILCPLTVGRPEEDEHADVTVSSSVDHSAASANMTNPFISAFINPSAAGVPSPHQTHTILNLSNINLNRWEYLNHYMIVNINNNNHVTMDSNPSNLPPPQSQWGQIAISHQQPSNPSASPPQSTFSNPMSIHNPALFRDPYPPLPAMSRHGATPLTTSQTQPDATTWKCSREPRDDHIFQLCSFDTPHQHP